MFVCGNQACGARWEQDEVQIRDEGQGLVFRCPQCGARNHVEARTAADGSTRYRQVPAKAAAKVPAKVADKVAQKVEQKVAQKAPAKRPGTSHEKPPARGRAKTGAKPSQR
ncbi:hypothetical protein E5S69_11530 [Cupriavidus necator]|uniref:hypothetical protein n=1 Tax=Cupriavidus necator TaxID=106590 RepID=UPI00148F89BD|nr:hypothetical protein [Cupriavidus necator]NOV24142.1 hypothetical protein [Cupriavidus necator]